jgi:hypothetical protein
MNNEVIKSRNAMSGMVKLSKETYKRLKIYSIQNEILMKTLIDTIINQYLDKIDAKMNLETKNKKKKGENENGNLYYKQP